MTTAKDDSVTNLEDQQVEELGDAEAEKLFAEAADALKGETPAKADDKPGDDDTAAPKPDDDTGEVTTGEGEGDDDSQGQTGGGEGEAATAAAEPGEGDEGALDPEALKAALAAAEERAKKAEQQFRSREGRERALSRELELLRAEGQTGKAEPRKPLKELLETDQIKAIGEEYPDFVPLIDALRETAERTDGVSTEVGQVKQGVVATAITAEETKLTSALPDWQDLAAHPEFQAWVDDRPKKERDIVADNWDAIIDADAVKGVFEAFRDRDKAPAPKDPDPAPGGDAGGKRARQAEGTKAAKVTSPAAASGESDDPEVLFRNAAAKVDRERGIR